MIYNCHIHTFKQEDVPRGFLPLGLVRVLNTRVGYFIFKNFLKLLNPVFKRADFNRYLKFVEIGKLDSQLEIFREVEKFYPTGTKFISLAMDMAYMNAGKVPRDYEEQVAELCSLPDNVLPFIHIDPRRKNALNLLYKYSSRVAGVKIYTPLGYMPFDDRLFPIYDYCQTNNLPIMAHCGGNTVSYKGSKKEIIHILTKYLPYDKKWEKMKKDELLSLFVNPRAWTYVLERYPKLNVCLAHWGADKHWDKMITNPSDKTNWYYIIKEMLIEYPNLYTDISFTLHNKEYFSSLKVLLQSKEKVAKSVLFGSDYYMIQTLADEKRFCLDLRGYLGEDLFQIIAKENVERYLKTNLW